MKRTLLLLLSLVVTASIWAQQFVITGVAKESATKAPVALATAALLHADSTAVLRTASTDTDGRFELKAAQTGKYTVRLSFLGFTTVSKRIELTAETDTLDLGTLLMESTDKTLGTATVSATAARVEQKEDTTVFNATAYRVPEGSTLESLVKQLPGVEVGDDGTIKWNGKTVTEFLVNGKDFFKGDTETAMKNLPIDLVSKIKAYDKKSDYAEQTGIDDGEESTVLDIATKRELNESWVTNIDVAYGNHDRYAGRVFASRFTDRSRITVFGAMNNTNNQGFGGPRGFGGSNGLTATKNAGMDFSWENDKKKFDAGRLELGGNVRYNHRSNDLISSSNSETFLTSGSKGSSFANSWRKNGSSSTNVNSSLRLQWSPDTMTTVSFRPSYSYSKSYNDGTSLSATFNSDPYEFSTSPLDSIFAQNVILNNPELYAIMVNTNQRLSMGDSKSHSVNGNLNVTRKLNSKGRNVSLQARGGYTKSESNSFSVSHINYNNTDNNNNKNFLNQYSTTPSKNYNYIAGIGYVEPLGKNWYGEARYRFSYRYQDSDRSRYNLDSLAYDPYKTLFPGYESFGDPDNYPLIGSLPDRDDVLNYVRDLNNSQYATYKYYNHTANLGVRYNSKTIRFNAGVNFNPEKTKMAYNNMGQHIDTLLTRKVFKVSPQVRFRYQFSKTDQLDVRYRGNSSQPSMTDLLAVVDDSDPLNISMGNPGLKPSWNNSLRINYRGYNPDRQQGIMGGVDFSQTSNSVSNKMVYDETTGVRYTRPENINGNWNGRGMLMFNTALGRQKLFNISTFTSVHYDNAVGYVSRMNQEGRTVSNRTLIALPTAAEDVENEHNYDFYNKIFNNASSEKNSTRTLGVDENLNLSYRATWYDFGILGRLNYQHARATVQRNANMDTWNFAYGANANFNLSFGLSISTDIRMTSRRGYSDASMNTNELVWNAQIAQSFLKNKAATLSIQFYDILQKQSTVSRTLSATQRVDSWTNAINSYFMVHFIYKFNVFSGSGGSKGSEQRNGNRNGERQGPPDMRGPGGMPMRPMGMPMMRM